MQIRGQVVHFSEPGQAQAQGIATIYQEFSLYPELTVTENIFSGHIPEGWEDLPLIGVAPRATRASCLNLGRSGYRCPRKNWQSLGW